MLPSKLREEIQTEQKAKYSMEREKKRRRESNGNERSKTVRKLECLGRKQSNQFQEKRHIVG